MNQNTDELLKYLNEISQKSLQGEIEWTHPNSSTFTWNQEGFIVSIQRATVPRLNRLLPQESVDFLFQVLKRPVRTVVLSLSSKERPDLAPALEGIYGSATRGVDVRASNVLRELLRK